MSNIGANPSSRTIYLLVTLDKKSGDMDTMDICTKLNGSPPIKVVLKITKINFKFFYRSKHLPANIFSPSSPLFLFSITPECDMLPTN